MGPQSMHFLNLDQGLNLFANDQLVSKLKNVILVPKEPSFPFLNKTFFGKQGPVILAAIHWGHWVITQTFPIIVTSEF